MKYYIYNYSDDRIIKACEKIKDAEIFAKVQSALDNADIGVFYTNSKNLIPNMECCLYFKSGKRYKSYER